MIMTSMHVFLGEGNFSFSTCVALSPDFPRLNTTLIATDYIPEINGILDCNKECGIEPEVKMKKERISLLKSNVSTLKSLGHTVLFDVDATKIHLNEKILSICRKSIVSRISVIFNFPHVKCKKMKIGLNRDLLRDFFRSCDDLYHALNDEKGKECSGEIEIIPIVSLCAGQSGIPEVDQVSREWGDSWQVNDMAAHGNFVCLKITNFLDWELFNLCNRKSQDSSSQNQGNDGYQSCYYRLQGGVGFSTENALTLTYQHRDHINPTVTNRLQLDFFKGAVLSTANLEYTFLQKFSPVLEEKVILTKKNSIRDSLILNGVNVRRNYNHVISISNGKNRIGDLIMLYLSECDKQTVDYSVEVIDRKIYMKNLTNGEIFTVGQFSDDEKVIELFADILIELGYKTDYRNVLSKAFSKNKGESLYPRTHEFHISFWLGPEFTELLFMETLLDVYGLMVKVVELVEEYTNDQGRKSLCWRIQVESLVLALSRQCCHQMQLTLRQELNKRLQVELR